MDNSIQQLHQSPLFYKILEGTIPTICDNLKAKIITYSKNEVIWRANQDITSIAFVLSGSVCVDNQNFLGHKNILRTVNAGEYFGEAHSVCDYKLYFGVESLEDNTNVIFFDSEKILNYNQNLEIGMQIRKNFINILAKKSASLNNKVFLLSNRSIRDKVISYLSFESTKQNSNYVTIKFNRQEMADYLSVDRVALSKELAKMKNENIIDYYKNEFHLLKLNALS